MASGRDPSGDDISLSRSTVTLILSCHRLNRCKALQSSAREQIFDYSTKLVFHLFKANTKGRCLYMLTYVARLPASSNQL